MRKWLLRAGIGMVAVYALVCLVARLSYRRFVYPTPPPHPSIPQGAELLTLRAADGEAVHALWFPPPPGGRVVAYFHGNGATMDDEVPLANDLVERGLGALLVEYRGYGASAGGVPGEKGIYLDAAAALDEVARRGVAPDRIALWGTSLGTGVAAEMARLGRGSTLVLVSPFTSLVDAAASHYGFLPMSLLIPDRFDTLAKAAAIHVPTLVVHGDRDDVIPFGQGQAVAAAIAGARFVPIAGAMHGDIYGRGGDALMEQIVARCASSH